LSIYQLLYLLIALKYTSKIDWKYTTMIIYIAHI
jgi:hypothetical protein